MTQPVGFFTLGISADRYQLPHPRIAFPVILLIRRVLCRAFQLLRQQGHNLATAKEDELTAALRSVIENDLRKTGEIRGFGFRTFHPVVRQGEVANFDGTRRSKTPDLCFMLQHENSDCRPVILEHDALFVECKPVDGKHPIGSRYCDDGLIRFVNGDYAWAMQQGIMLAYVRKDRTIADHLIPVMSEQHRMTSLQTVQLPKSYGAAVTAPDSRAEALHISKHNRTFSWPHNKGTATDITVYHLWHDCE